jgi:hypothetical protein
MPKLSDYIHEALEKGIEKEEIVSALQKKGYSLGEINNAFRVQDSEIEVEIKESSLGYFNKIKLLFLSPNDFFEKVRDRGIGKAITLLLVVCLLFGVALVLLSFAFRIIASSGGTSMYSFGLFNYLGLGFFMPMVYTILILFGSFIYAGLAHLLAKMMGGKGRTIDSYNAVAYSLIPGVILAIVPLVGMLSFIYSVVLTTFGLSKYHKVSKGKAAFAAICPAIIPIILILLIVLYIFMVSRRYF